MRTHIVTALFSALLGLTVAQAAFPAPATGTPAPHQKLLWALAVSPKGEVVASGDIGGNICIWDIGSRKLARSWKADKDPVYSLQFTGSGKALLCGLQGRVVTYDTETWSRTHEERVLWKANAAGARQKVPRPVSLAFSPDGKSIALGLHDELDGALEIWSEGRKFNLLPKGRVYGCLGVFFPNNDEVWGVFQSGAIEKWHIKKRQRLIRRDYPAQEVPTQTQQLSSATVSIKAEALIVVNVWHQLLVVDINDGSVRHTIEDESVGTWCTFLDVSPDGNWAISGGGSGKCHVWDLTSGTLHHSFPAEATFGRATFLGTSDAISVLNKQYFLLWSRTQKKGATIE